VDTTLLREVQYAQTNEPEQVVLLHLVGVWLTASAEAALAQVLASHSPMAPPASYQRQRRPTESALPKPPPRWAVRSRLSNRLRSLPTDPGVY
jgi:hypothetical protein